MANTLHHQKNARKSTWHSPDGKTHNQIDFIQTPQRFKSSINKSSTRTYTRANISSDYDLVLCNLQIKLKRSKKGKYSRIRYDVDKLLNPEVKETFQKEIIEKLAKIDLSNQSTNVSYNDIAESMTNAADITLGKVRTKKYVWITDVIREEG